MKMLESSLQRYDNNNNNNFWDCIEGGPVYLFIYSDLFLADAGLGAR